MSRDAFGFRFWLGWIFWFAASFILIAIFWTRLVTALLGPVRGPELTMTWSLAVFGSWFLAVIPFMRKKEKIWKRLNVDQESALDAWLGGMGVFIGLLIAAAFFWSLHYKSRLGQEGLSGEWLKAVFLTWLVLMLPFLILLYRQADRIFKTAVERQTPKLPVFRSLLVEHSRRLLPEKISQKIRRAPAVLREGHIVNALLKDGRKIPHVFVMGGTEILGVYDRTELGFEADDIMDIEILAPGDLPVYEESKWLRIDGRV